MKVEQGVLSFKVNEENLGNAYEDDNLMGEDLVPFVWLNEGDGVTILQGELS